MITRPHRSPARAAIFACALAAAVACGGCKRSQPAEPAPIDQATQYEVLQLAEVKQSGLSDSDCLELIQLARKTGQPFSDGDSIAELLGAGESKDTVLTLARMNQLGVFSGQVLAMHLAKIPDPIILDVAQRRAANEPSLSGDTIAELLEAGYTQAQVTGLLDKGTTDAEAQPILDYRHRASAHDFVKNRGRSH
jgi:hypothetical protein